MKWRDVTPSEKIAFAKLVREQSQAMLEAGLVWFIDIGHFNDSGLIPLCHDGRDY